MHALDGLVDVIQAVLGGPSLDLVLGGKLENFGDILWRTDEGSGEVDVGHDEGSGRDGGELALGYTNEDKVSTWSEKAEVGLEGHLLVVYIISDSL